MSQFNDSNLVAELFIVICFIGSVNTRAHTRTARAHTGEKTRKRKDDLKH